MPVAGLDRHARVALAFQVRQAVVRKRPLLVGLVGQGEHGLARVVLRHLAHAVGQVLVPLPVLLQVELGEDVHQRELRVAVSVGAWVAAMRVSISVERRQGESE